jgi:hypothetical protein
MNCKWKKARNSLSKTTHIVILKKYPVDTLVQDLCEDNDELIDSVIL